MTVSRRLRHFLLVYDCARSRLRSVRTFIRADQALAAYQAAEAELLGDDDVQVVLVAADSIATVKKTHSNFWHGESVETLLRDALAQR